ncbi:MAG: hypothetical protein ABSB74_17740 [Tepidisphaeraceae bacterium]
MAHRCPFTGLRHIFEMELRDAEFLNIEVLRPGQDFNEGSPRRQSAKNAIWPQKQGFPPAILAASTCNSVAKKRPSNFHGFKLHQYLLL